MRKIVNLSVILFTLWSCTEIEYEDQNLPDITNLTIQSIVTDHDVLNVTVNEQQFAFLYRNYSADTVIPASLAYYNNLRVPIIQNAKFEMEIKGAASAGNNLKSLGLLLDSTLNNANLQILNPEHILSNHNLDVLKTFRLRNSGNDFNLTMLKDLTYTELAIQAGLNVELMYGKPVQVFLNEEYYGLMNLRTESNATGMAQLLGQKTEAITLLKIDVDNAKLEYREGNENWANELIRAIKDEDADKLWELIDVDSYIDYIVYQDYIGNRDWPENNMRVYSLDREKFRFILYDLDYAAFNTKKPLIPSFEFKEHHMARIYNGLRAHPTFDSRFDARQKEIYKLLTPNRFNSILQRFAERIENDMLYQIAKYKEPENSFYWRIYLSELQRDFDRRNKYIREKYDL